MNGRRLLARTIGEITAAVSPRRHRPGLRILMYHAVGTRLGPKQDPLRIYSIDAHMFERQMELLSSLPNNTMVALDSAIPSNDVLQVAVTFDDGYKDNLHTAAPVMQKYAIPFTVFVTAEFVRSGSAEFMSPSELKSLADYPGATIGTHGESHAPLASCDQAHLLHELRDSQRYLEDLLGKPVHGLSYPHGSVTAGVRAKAAEAGYTLGVCSHFDINRPGRDPLLLCRSIIRADDSERVFLQKLNGDWDWCRWVTKDPAKL